MSGNGNVINHYTCSVCSKSLASTYYSKTQLNKLQYNKIDSVRCLNCTEDFDNSHSNNTKKGKVLKEQDVLTISSKNTKQDKPSKKSKSIDPSIQYIDNPLSIPSISDAKSFAQLYDLTYPVTLGAITGWRTVVKMAVRGNIRVNKQGKEYIVTNIGLFKPRTHQVISCIESSSHHVVINKALSIIDIIRSKLAIEGYIEGTGIENIDINHKYKSYMKYLILVLARQTNQVQLTIVWNTSPLDKEGEKILNSFIKELLSYNKKTNNNSDKNSDNNIFHSIWINYNPSSRYNNAITSREMESWKLIYGNTVIEDIITTDMLHPPVLRFPPNVFRQANICAFTNIIRKIRLWINKILLQPTTTTTTTNNNNNNNNNNKQGNNKEDIQCIELYGGVGTIGLNCLDLLSKLNCSDENPNNKICFDTTLSNMKKNQDANYDSKKQVYYTSLSATEVVQQTKLRHYDLVIVDPPRKGLDQEVIDALLQYHSEDCIINKMLIYVSCGFQAFKRDTAKLTAMDFAVDVFKQQQQQQQQQQSNTATNNNTITTTTNNNNKKSVIPSQSTLSNKRVRNSSNNNSTNYSSSSIRYWKLIHIEGFVLFPGSDHIETLAIFTRLL